MSWSNAVHCASILVLCTSGCFELINLIILKLKKKELGGRRIWGTSPWGTMERLLQHNGTSFGEKGIEKLSWLRHTSMQDLQYTK